MARVIFINPHNPEFVLTKERHMPLGILYLSSSLKECGHEVGFIDIANRQISDVFNGTGFDLGEYYRKEIKAKIADFSPDAVGISVHFSGRFLPAIEISRLIKDDFPAVPIVLGGIHPTIFPEEILRDYPYIDFVLRGEGEGSFIELLKYLKGFAGDPEQIDGLGYRKNGTIKVNAKRKFIVDVDSIPFPDYSLVDIKDYFFDTGNWFNPKKMPINTSLFVLSSRSCPRQCSFCSMFIVHGPKHRIRSARSVLEELEYLYREKDHRYYSFIDDNFTLNKKRAMEICNGIIERGMNIQFDTPNGLEINTLDEELLDSLVRAGMVKTCLAVESGSEFIRGRINKRLKQEKIFECFRILNKHPNLIYNVFFIVGFPDETPQTLRETYDLISTLGIKKCVISFATPFPGTKLYQECISCNLLDDTFGQIHRFDRFYFAHDTPFIKPYNLEKSDLINFRSKVYQELGINK